MSSASLHYEIGFADSEVVSYCKNDNGFVVRLRLWNEESVDVHFHEACAVLDWATWAVADLRKTDEHEDFLDSALCRQYDVVPKEHGYSVYEFIDVDGAAAMMVVATRVSFRRCDAATS